MKRLRFESLELLSLAERKARKIEFHPLLTVITGTNDVGKSSVIKSLYWTLGASPAITHSTWSAANVKALLTFTVDDVRYRVVRDRNTIGVFCKDGRPLLITDQFTKELGPFLANLLNFKLVLTSRNGIPETPPPAYAFLPFYIDQDGGWTKPLESFSRLTQYADFKKPLLEFHTGILPNEYYELEAEKRRIQVNQRDLEADRRVVLKAVERLELEVEFDGLELSIEGHEQAIEQLLRRMTLVQQLRQERAKKLAAVQDEKLLIEQQVLIVRASITELEKDATFAAELPAEVLCPTCGTNHYNDFANRFGIVEDREYCFDFIAQTRNRLTELTLTATKAEEELRVADRIIAEIQASINEKKGATSLNDIIQSRSKIIASNAFNKHINELNTRLGDILFRIKAINEDLKKLRNKDRRKKIVDFYVEFMKTYLMRLDVTNFSAQEVYKIPARISETGSDLPRAILAYFLALIQTISEYSTSLFAPIVVDSPNQQDQDDVNVLKMIDLIIAERPHHAQVILGTVSLHGRDVANGKVIDLTEKYSVMSSADFEAVSASLRPYLEKMTA